MSVSLFFYCIFSVFTSQLTPPGSRIGQAVGRRSSLGLSRLASGHVTCGARGAESPVPADGYSASRALTGECRPVMT